MSKNASSGLGAGRWCIDWDEASDPLLPRFPLVGDGEGFWPADGDHPIQNVAGDLGLEKDAPAERPIETREMGEAVAISRVGGLHHRYSREFRSAA
jgi:hypothetical protein